MHFRLEKELEHLKREQVENDILRSRIPGIQRENVELKMETSRLKENKARMKMENEKLTEYLTNAIEEKSDIEGKLNDTQLQLKEVRRRLDDEIAIATYSKEVS